MRIRIPPHARRPVSGRRIEVIPVKTEIERGLPRVALDLEEVDLTRHPIQRIPAAHSAVRLGRKFQ
jgi:hypothetical protein